MSALFLKILNMSLNASWLIIAVVIVRVFLKKSPKWVSCLLCGLVAFRLICPFTIQMNTGTVPSFTKIREQSGRPFFTCTEEDYG